MRCMYLSALILLGFSACKKEHNTSFTSTHSADGLAAADTIRIPLTQMPPGTTYYGYSGGLYANGANQPSGDYAKDLRKSARSIVPLDSFGNAAPDGLIGFISIGSSLVSKMFIELERLTETTTLAHPNIQMANCTGGGVYLQIINDSTSEYWPIAERKLRDNHIHRKQVQVVYLESEDSILNTAFPQRPLATKDQIAKAVRLFKIKYPNLKIVYLSGRTTTFLAPGKKSQNREPNPYYNGWACKFVIQDQVNGNPGLAYKGPNAVASMVTWGWYKWSVGNVPRDDGFLWKKSYTTDGMHPSDEGAVILATNYQQFLLNDPIASIWYANPGSAR